MTVYVDDIRRVNNAADVSVPISECFRTIEIKCTKTETSGTGIIASVEDNDGTLLLKTDNNWECLSYGDSGHWTDVVTDVNNLRPKTSEEISTSAIPIWSEDTSFRTAFCRRIGNLQREGKRFLWVARTFCRGVISLTR